MALKTKVPGIPLKSSFTPDLTEAGCDEAGRGCLAGPVYAAAVILPKDFMNGKLNDSKQLRASVRYELRSIIEEHAVAWAVASVSPAEIDEINILQSSFLAMHRALDVLAIRPQFLLVDGNRFNPYRNIPHQCIVKGDAKYLSIAAASILAKTYRDDYMMTIHQEFPEYCWKNNKGYPSRQHTDALIKFGFSPYHRRSFHYKGQLKLPL